MIRKFSVFVQKYILKKKETSSRKYQQVLSSLNLTDIKICLRNGRFSSDIGKINLNPSKGSHWVCYINEKHCDSYGCVCPKKLSKLNLKRSGHCLYSEYKLQGLTSERDFYCASCSFKI